MTQPENSAVLPARHDDPPPGLGIRILQWLGQHPYTTVTTIALLAMGITAAGRRTSEWTEVIVQSARALLHGKDIYVAVPHNTYLPFTAWITVPFAVIPAHLAQGIWFAVLAVCLVYVIRTSWRLAGGGALEGSAHRRAAGRSEQAAFIVGNIIALQFALNSLTHLQTDLLIAALLTAGCVEIAAERWRRGAVWIGLGAAFKATPLLFVPWLLWRRKWAAAAILLATMIGANLLADTVHRPGDYGTWLNKWAHLYLFPMASANYLPGDWKNLLNNNQAISGAARRWLTTSWRDSPTEYLSAASPSDARKHAIWIFELAACLALLVPVLWSARRVPAETGPPSGAARRATIVECGMVMLLMLLYSPNSSRAHFCILYLPAFCVARSAIDSPIKILLALSAIFSTLSIHIRLPFTEGAEQTFLWLGVVMWSAIFLLLACIIVRRRLSRGTPYEAPQSGLLVPAPAEG
ncbi:MAG TPA: glycosyltransferase family 87 protein [Tepidisphaeraceae bacterium]|jgi:hypothetical protein|nr:glycosyltransferase family 87 protein [Tepidisphaeraceae bacterium]